MSEQDWGELQKIAHFLEYFHDATLANETRFATIDLILPTMDFLLEKFEEAKRMYADDQYMGPCCNAGWAKLDKYYSLTDKSPVYIAALVLCPQWKWSYFEDNWPAEWISAAKEVVQTLWEQDYKPTETPIPIPSTQEDPKLKNAFLKWRAEKKGIPIQGDEYIQYLRTPTVDITDTDA